MVGGGGTPILKQDDYIQWGYYPPNADQKRKYIKWFADFQYQTNVT